MGTTSNFEAQMDRKMGVDAPLRPDGPMVDDEAAEERQFDELAEAMRGAGLDAATAVKATRAAILFFGKKDREVCGEVAMEWVASDSRPERLMQALGRVWGARDARFSLSCLFLAMDFEPVGVMSLRQLAAARGLSPEAVSMEVEAHQQILGLAVTKLQKSAAAKASYKKSNGGAWKVGLN